MSDEKKSLIKDFKQNNDIIVKGEFDYSKFIDDFESKPKEAIEQLLALQDNANPLKKGGTDITYRSSIIINKNRQKWNSKENVIMDILMATVSSYPENNSFQITTDDMKKILNTDDNVFIHNVLANAESLSKKPLVFEYNTEDGSTATINIPWYNIFAFDSKGKGNRKKVNTIAFSPSPFFKMLTLSCGISRGAIYSAAGAALISADHQRNLFNEIILNLGHKEYEGAISGLFKLSLEELKEKLQYSDSYTANDVKRMIIEKTKKIVNDNWNINHFIFDFADIKEGKKIVGFWFYVIRVNSEKEYEEALVSIKNKLDDIVKAKKTNKKQALYESLNAEKEAISNEQNDVLSVNETMISTALKGTNYFTDSEIDIIINDVRKYNRDFTFFTLCLGKVVNLGDGSKIAFLRHLLKNGVNTNNSKQNRFDISNRSETYQMDIEDFEKDILSN